MAAARSPAAAARRNPSTLAVGASGGASGTAGPVGVNSSGVLTSTGENAYGILAQSIAGTGGNAGSVISVDAFSSDSVSLSLGGTGGDGVSADSVTVNTDHSITTSGSNATAILAQSIGGGGGSGGSSYSGSLSMQSISLSVGGEGGDGGTSGEVTVNNDATLQTGGVYAYGISAQSIGGSGGSGGSVMNIAVSAGEVAGAVDLSLGGSGGDGGTAGTTTVTNKKTITTDDFGSSAILAQSIGGAGGSGGSVISGELVASTDTSVGVSVSVGGDGGSGGAAGDVTVTNEGALNVYGDLAQGVVAQSIGGDGGVGGSSYSLVASVNLEDKYELSTSVGGDGGTGSVAATVKVGNTAEINTYGGASNGIYAQSIGGNGGSGGCAYNLLANFASTSTDTFSGKAEVAVGGTRRLRPECRRGGGDELRRNHHSAKTCRGPSTHKASAAAAATAAVPPTIRSAKRCHQVARRTTAGRSASRWEDPEAGPAMAIR